MKLGIVIVAYKDQKFLEGSLKSIKISLSVQCDVVVVDNSPDETLKEIVTRYSNTTYIKSPENLGFCAGNNLGIQYLLKTHQKILLLNHDTELDSDCLAHLLKTSIEKDPCIVTGKILMQEDPGKLWYGGGYFSKWIGAGCNKGFNQEDSQEYSDFEETDYATGCMMLVDSKIFEKVGLLNEKMFMYLDDIEFCLRVRNMGFKIFYNPLAKVYHHLGSGISLKKRPGYYLYFSIRNKPLVSSKPTYNFYLRLITLIVAGIKISQYLTYPGIQSRVYKIKMLFFGLIDAYSKKSMYKKRCSFLFE